MANLKEIRSRISSVFNNANNLNNENGFQQKLKRAQDAITQMRPYANKLTELLQNLTASLDSSEEGFTLLKERLKMF